MMGSEFGVRSSEFLVAGGWGGLRVALVVLVVVGLLSGGGCSKQPQRHFYTMTYPMSKPLVESSYPYSVRVRDLDISSTYGSIQLVFREDVHEIRYYQTRRWTEPPQRMVSDLIRKSLIRSRLVRQVTENLEEKAPDYVLQGEIEALEQLRTGTVTWAHLAVSLRLVHFPTDQIVYRYSFDRRERVTQDNVRATVRAISLILEQELQTVLEQLGQIWAEAAQADPEGAAAAAAGVPPAAGTGTTPPGIVTSPGGRAPTASGGATTDPDEDVPIGHEEGPPAPDRFRPDLRSRLNHHPQLLADETDMPASRGAIFLPALSDTLMEPVLGVYRRGDLVATGVMGRRVVVEPGSYEVRFGSGAGDQQLAVQVLVEEGRVTPVQPGWAALRVRVVNDHFIDFRGTYEIINMASQESYGIGFGVDEELGEELRSWVLRPGLYKLIRAGGNYRDRSNFATVKLEAGEFTDFILVQDEQTADFKGAGVADPDMGTALSPNWTLKSIFGGNALINRTDLSENLDDWDTWNLNVGLFLDLFLKYREEAHEWWTRLEIEEEQTIAAGTENWSNMQDRFYVQTLYTYDLLRWFGPYARVRLDSNLLPSYDDSKEERFKLSDPFSPITLQEGAGGNFRILNNLAMVLDLRVGLGAKQVLIPGEAYEKDRTAIPESFRTGTEGTVTSFFRISRWVTLSAELELFRPFDLELRTDIKWQSRIMLRLASFASLNYSLTLKREEGRELNEWGLSGMEHHVQLRFSYNLF